MDPKRYSIILCSFDKILIKISYTIPVIHPLIHYFLNK